MDSAFSNIPTIVVYSGHRTDEPVRTTPRFPSEEVARVQKEIEQSLTKLKASILIGSASSGADLLVLESSKGISDVEIVLPSPPESFARHSVASDWQERFEQQLDLLSIPPTILNQHHPCLLYTSPSPRD